MADRPRRPRPPARNWATAPRQAALRRDPDLLAEQVAAAFRQTPIAVLVSSVNASLMAALGGADPRALVWLAAILLVGAMRLATWQAHRRDLGGAEHATRWARAATTAAIANGVLWGAGAAWLWPQAEAAQLFWVFAIGGMAAGAVALNHAHLPTALGFILPAGLPVAALFALEGSPRGLAAAAMIGVFLLALVLTSRRSSAQFVEHQRLRFDLSRQARELDATAARLRIAVEDGEATAASLRHAQKMEALGQLTGGVAHDFNNLLMAVLGSLALLRKRLPADDEAAARLLGNAVQAADRGAALTQRLLDFGRRKALRPEAVDLAVLVQGMADLLRRSIGPGQSLDLRIPSGLPAARGDANQLELAVLNLVLNARDAMPLEGTVTIAATACDVASGNAGGLAAGRYVVLSVADTGAGMDAATLARATEPFFTTKGVGQGTGLGLSMVHGLAAQSDGRLVLHSRVGIGTVAEMWLPIADARVAAAPAAATPVRTPPPAPARRLSVLVVDDDPLVLESAAGMLEGLGHLAIGADSGQGALERLRGITAVDLVITDYGMPGMSGLQLARALRQLYPGLPVLLASGYGDVSAIDAFELPRLCKPFGEAALHAAIEAAIGAAPRR